MKSEDKPAASRHRLRGANRPISALTEPIIEYGAALFLHLDPERTPHGLHIPLRPGWARRSPGLTVTFTKSPTSQPP